MLLTIIKTSMTIYGNNTSRCYIYLDRSDVDVVKSNIKGFYLDRGDIDGVKLSGLSYDFYVDGDVNGESSILLSNKITNSSYYYYYYFSSHVFFASLHRLNRST